MRTDELPLEYDRAASRRVQPVRDVPAPEAWRERAREKKRAQAYDRRREAVSFKEIMEAEEAIWELRK